MNHTSTLQWQRCPGTGQVMQNGTRSFGQFHVSFNNRVSDYGCVTTALVLQGRVFFVLNGNHVDALISAAEERGIQGCVDVLIERIADANTRSEHRAAVGLDTDHFNLLPTTIDTIGQDSVDRIAKALMDLGDGEVVDGTDTTNH